MTKLSIGDIVVSIKDRSPMTVTKASNIEGKPQLLVECERHDNGSVQDYWADTLQKVGTTNPPVVPELPVFEEKAFPAAVPAPDAKGGQPHAPGNLPDGSSEGSAEPQRELTVEERAALFNRGNA